MLEQDPEDWRDEVVDALLNFHGDGCNDSPTSDVAGISLDPAPNNAPADIAADAPPLEFEFEEESQVVPSSLDHLSRDELCRMICRLDYERNTLRDQLSEATLQNQQLHQFATELQSHYDKKRKTLPRPNVAARSSQSAHPAQYELTQGVDGGATAAVATMQLPPPLMSPLEISKLHKQQQKIGQKLLSAIKKTAVHGVRLIPQTSVAVGGLSLAKVTAMMRNRNGQKVGDTRRMVRWRLSDDRQIGALLRSERLIHPVRHNGSDHVLPPGSLAANVYHWARWRDLEVRYDKRKKTLSLVAKTVVAGCGQPEHARELLRYSRGELEDFPGEGGGLSSGPPREQIGGGKSC